MLVNVDRFGKKNKKTKTKQIITKINIILLAVYSWFRLFHLGSIWSADPRFAQMCQKRWTNRKLGSQRRRREHVRQVYLVVSVPPWYEWSCFREWRKKERKGEKSTSSFLLPTSNSPLKYCLSNSLFSPTYELIILLICRFRSNTPSPKSSTPALFDTAVRPFTCGRSRSALIRFSGIPHRPNPPTSRVEFEGISCTACCAEGYTLFKSLLVADAEKARRRTYDGLIVARRHLKAGKVRENTGILVEICKSCIAVIWIRTRKYRADFFPLDRKTRLWLRQMKSSHSHKSSAFPQSHDVTVGKTGSLTNTGEEFIWNCLI